MDWYNYDNVIEALSGVDTSKVVIERWQNRTQDSWYMDLGNSKVPFWNNVRYQAGVKLVQNGIIEVVSTRTQNSAAKTQITTFRVK